MGTLDDQVVAITGASRGIGRATARAAAEAGASVALLARSDDDLHEIAAAIGDDRALPLPCDVAAFDEVSDAVTATLDHFGRLDVLVNNAGLIEPIAPVHEADPDQWATTVDVNLTGCFHGVRAAAPVMVARGGGTIITISSGAAHRPKDGWSAYCASKAGAAMLTASVHLELADRGVRAIGLSPGTVATDMQRTIRDSGVNEVSQLDWDQHIPPEWVATAVVWLAGEAGDDWQGQEVRLRDRDVLDAVGLG